MSALSAFWSLIKRPHFHAAVTSADSSIKVLTALVAAAVRQNAEILAHQKKQQRDYIPAAHCHHRVAFIRLTVNEFSVLIPPHMELHMTTIVNIGHTLNLAIEYLDQRGNPMVTVPVPDAAPAWSNTAPSVETLEPSPSGMTAVATPVTPGLDTVNLFLAVGGVPFSASLAVEVDAAVQVLSSVQISATVV